MGIDPLEVCILNSLLIFQLPQCPFSIIAEPWSLGGVRVGCVLLNRNTNGVFLFVSYASFGRTCLPILTSAFPSLLFVLSTESLSRGLSSLGMMLPAMISVKTLVVTLTNLSALSWSKSLLQILLSSPVRFRHNGYRYQLGKGYFIAFL